MVGQAGMNRSEIICLSEGSAVASEPDTLRVQATTTDPSFYLLLAPKHVDIVSPSVGSYIADLEGPEASCLTSRKP